MSVKKGINQNEPLFMKTDTEIKSIWSNSQNDICYSIIYIINGKNWMKYVFV